MANANTHGLIVHSFKGSPAISPGVVLISIASLRHRTHPLALVELIVVFVGFLLNNTTLTRESRGRGQILKLPCLSAIFEALFCLQAVRSPTQRSGLPVPGCPEVRRVGDGMADILVERCEITAFWSKQP